MASWYDSNKDLQAALTGKDMFVEENVLTQEPLTFFGPPAQTVKAALPDLLGDMPLTNEPWKQPEASRAYGIGVNNTYWVLSPRSPRKGIWVLNASSSEATRAAQAAGSPTQYGYYLRATQEIPPLQQIIDSGLIFEKKFTEGYYQAYPDQDPRPKKQPAKPTAKVKTFELFGLMNGEPVLATDVLTYAGPGDYILADGAQLLVGDAPADGFGLGGDPGKWNLYYPGGSPAQFGLAGDKGVLMWDGQKGVALTGDLLKDIYGAQWKSTIYG